MTFTVKMHAQFLQTLRSHLRNVIGMHGAKIDGFLNCMKFQILRNYGKNEILVKIFHKI